MSSIPVDMALRAHDSACFLTIRVLLVVAIAVDDWRRLVRRRAAGLRGSLRKLLRAFLRRHRLAVASTVRRRGWNRTPREVEDAVVRMHVEAPQLGAGQLRRLARRVLAFEAARETIRRILLRNQGLIAELEEEKRRPARRIEVRNVNRLWGLDLTLVWVLGFFPVWVLGMVDYHGSRLVALDPLALPTASRVVAAVDRAFARRGLPARVLTDRGTVFRSDAFEELLGSRGVKHTTTRPCHPWTNGRIERLFRTFKETVRRCFWIVRSRAQLERICADFALFYNGHRPHEAYDGRTPDEVHFDRALCAGHRGRIAFFDGRLRWWRFS